MTEQIKNVEVKNEKNEIVTMSAPKLESLKKIFADTNPNDKEQIKWWLEGTSQTIRNMIKKISITYQDPAKSVKNYEIKNTDVNEATDEMNSMQKKEALKNMFKNALNWIEEKDLVPWGDLKDVKALWEELWDDIRTDETASTYTVSFNNKDWKRVAYINKNSITFTNNFPSNKQFSEYSKKINLSNEAEKQRGDNNINILNLFKSNT